MSGCTTVHRDPKLLKGREDGLWKGRWVAAQKPPQQHLAGETSLLWLTQGPAMLLGLNTQERTLWSSPTNLIHVGNDCSRA